METKSIEERAQKAALKCFPQPSYNKLRFGFKCGYKEGVTEQREIDIQKAVDKMKGILSMPIMKYITKSDVQPILDELVKAMKGK